MWKIKAEKNKHRYKAIDIDFNDASFTMLTFYCDAIVVIVIVMRAAIVTLHKKLWWLFCLLWVYLIAGH